MLVKDFDFELPEALISHYPTPERTSSRLLSLDGLSGKIRHHVFTDIQSYLQPGDLLVMNNTRVIPARLFGRKSTGGKVEVLVERVKNEHHVLAHVRSGKSPKPGTMLLLEEHIEAEVTGRQGELFMLAFRNNETVLSLLNQYGHVPLPPYIEREDEAEDKERYQTVYAKREGAVAAPTAGLHFDQPLLNKLKAKGINTAFVTLHVGAGTFQPVRVNRVEDHHMHSEYLEVSQEVCELVRKTKASGRRIVAVGTTSVRCLETASKSGDIQPFQGETNIFIYPGYEFQSVDLLITNFHLPQSTLLMLVSAFSGQSFIQDAYAQAIEKNYRFFSYGDAMLLSKSGTSLKK